MPRHLFTVLLLAACAPNTETQVTTFERDDFLRVVVFQAYGNVSVRSGVDTKVERVLEWAGDVMPVVRTRLVGDTLMVFTDSPKGSRRCVIDLDIVVPEVSDVDVQSAEGDVTLTSVAGVIDLDVTAGDVLLKDVTGNTRVNLIEGAISLDRVVGRLDLSVGDGEVFAAGLSAPTFSLTTEKGGADLIFADQPDILTISTQRGDITVQMPRGEYEVTANAPRGDVSVLGVINTIDAGSLVDLYTRKGDISIKGN